MTKTICSGCWGVFEARRESAKFCSPACRQRAHRIKHGQPDKRILTEFDVDERVVCAHCHTGFYCKGKGRKPRFCSQSCRVMDNRHLQAACAKFVYAMNGSSLNWTRQECAEYVKEKGTKHIIEWAEKANWEYSSTTHRFWKKSLELWAVNHA